MQRTRFLFVFAMLPLICCGPAAGQEAPQATPLDEIIVTGTKRQTTLQDADLAATVLSRKVLDEARVVDIRRIDDLAPNVQFNDSSPLGAVYISIRGVESNPFIVNRAAVYIDGIPFRELNNSVLSQIESVEVLRGPQSTLYGANTEIGLILINTSAPSDELHVDASATASSYDTGEHYQVDAYIGGPLVTNELAGSVAMRYSERDYFLENIGATPQGPGVVDELFVQGRLRWTPTDQFEVNATGYIINTDAPGIYRFDGFPVDVDRFNQIYSDGILFDPADPFSVPPGNGSLRASDYQFVHDAPKRAQIDDVVLGLSAAYVIEPGKFTLGISHRNEEIDDRGFDIDNSNLPILAGTQIEDVTVSNAELRFDSREDRALVYSLGLSYYLEDNAATLGSLVGPGTLNDFNFAPNQTVESRDVGIFASASYTPEAFPEWTATVGIRYDEARRQTSQQAGSLDLGFAVFLFDALQLEETFDATLPRFALRYEPSDNLTLYSNIAKGYLPGGFNIAAAQDGFQEQVVRYESEELWSYEFGLKWRLPEQNLFLATAIFYIEADNYQEISALIDEQGNVVSTSFVGSDAAIRSQGFEIEGSWQPTENLSVTGNFGFVDAEYTDFAAADAPVVIGNPVKLVPEYDANLAVRYEFANGIFVRGEANLTGDIALDEGDRTGFTTNALDTQEAVETFNLQFGYQRERLTIRAFVENISDERRISGAGFPNAVFPVDGLLYGSIDSPRTVGLEVSFQY
ncbi:MAG: TonB-dependent receptor [Pseudomonadota bacterium]